MELRDLYDENKSLTGEVIKAGEKFPNNRRILVVAIWIQNSKGEILLQQRSFGKSTAPGKWATTGGHPKHGETSLQGMITEISEELGIKVQEDELEFVNTSSDEYTFADIYYIKKDLDINDMILQEEEVEKVKWVTIEELEEMIKTGEFADIHIDLYEETKELLKSRC